MKHAIGYLGHIDRDLTNLRPGVRYYVRKDGRPGPVDAPPDGVDGIFFGYLECPGKKYVAVRAQYGDIDVIVKTPVPLDPHRHTEGKGCGPNPSQFGDEAAENLLADMISLNPDSEELLRRIADQVGLELK